MATKPRANQIAFTPTGGGLTDIQTAFGGTDGAENIGWVQDGSPTTGDLAARKTKDVATKLTEFVSVRDFGAKGDGVADDTAAIQAALNVGGNSVVPAGSSYLLNSDVTLQTDSVLIVEPGASLTGTGRVLNSGVGVGSSIPKNEVFGKYVIRDSKYNVTHSNGFETSPNMGQVLRLDASSTAGQCAVFLSGDQREPVIGETHYVGFHSRHNNTTNAPNLWGLNPVVVKNITTSTSPTGKASVIGMEISVSNNTSEAGTPLQDGSLGGLFVSYIRDAQMASYAFATGGYPSAGTPGDSGFNNLLWLDGVTSNGTHISLRDEVSANAGAKRGLDCSAVASFTDAAIVLGNGGTLGGSGQKVAGRRSDTGAVCQLISLNASNFVEIGDSASLGVSFPTKPVFATGSMDVGSSTTSFSYIDFHSSQTSSDYDARILVNGGSSTAGAGSFLMYSDLTQFYGRIRPSPDNTLPCGEASYRWSVIYAGTGTINTSDAREKQQVRDLSDAERAVAVRLKSMIRAFKFNDAVMKKGDGARIHFGVIAQDVKAAFEAEGLVAEDYAMLCYDEWPETPEERDPEGNLVQEYRPAGNRYGVRYEELLSFIIATL